MHYDSDSRVHAEGKGSEKRYDQKQGTKSKFRKTSAEKTEQEINKKEKTILDEVKNVAGVLRRVTAINMRTTRQN